MWKLSCTLTKVYIRCTKAYSQMSLSNSLTYLIDSLTAPQRCLTRPLFDGWCTPTSGSLFPRLCTARTAYHRPRVSPLQPWTSALTKRKLWADFSMLLAHPNSSLLEQLAMARNLVPLPTLFHPLFFLLLHLLLPSVSQSCFPLCAQLLPVPVLSAERNR